LQQKNNTMSNAIFSVPTAINEPIYSYAPGTPEREGLLTQYKKMYNQEPIEVPMYIGNQRVTTNNKKPMSPPHDHKKVLGHYNFGDASHVTMAIDAALAAKDQWANMPWQDRAAIFLRAADLLAGPYRYKMNAATMLAQSKNVFQSEIDSICELIDFLRFNVQFMSEVYAQQPISGPGVWNRLEYRPLEGFIFAVTPFNFTAIAANLCAAPAMMGNVIVWKPAESQMYSAQVIMEVFQEAGLPDGVVNMISVPGPLAGEIVFKHRELAGLNFTGSTGVFRHMWKEVGMNIENYRSYPRVVGETGGKDFIVAHNSADAHEVATAISRGAFEFQGQKCSAASRGYVPQSLWGAVKPILVDQVKSFKMGTTEDPSNYINAVIDEKAFDKIASYIDAVKAQSDAEIIVGGNYDKSKGYFIEPTIVVTTNPKARTMCEEIFGPVMTLYIYDDKDFEDVLTMVDETSDYALTGSILSKDRYVINHVMKRLENAAGNFYINDKPTGAVVGQQPFGGARGSGTNDKAGAPMNLLRWTSARTIKETFVTPKDYKYPFLG
jgi:1-pyrroline-5-carboxylate dehydrogenase